MKLKRETLNQTKLSKSYAMQSIKANKMTYLFLIPGAILTIIFGYLPLPGLYMAFVEYNPFRGIFGSPFVGLENIIEIFTMPDFVNAILNTIKLSVLNLLIVFPIPIIFSLMLNEVRNQAFKRVTQTLSYLPYFISTIAVVGIAMSIYSEAGILNDMRVSLFGPETERILFLSLQKLFVPNIVILTIWQTTG